jgi:hypothetical protein
MYLILLLLFNQLIITYACFLKSKKEKVIDQSLPFGANQTNGGLLDLQRHLSSLVNLFFFRF